MLVSIHIPKTGGISFQGLLEALFGAHLVLDYGDKILLPNMWWRRLGRPVGVRAVPVPADTACIHGHFLARKYDRKYPHALKVTWFRDPVERLISHYQFWLRKPDPDHPLLAQWGGTLPALSDFAAARPLRNVYSTYLDGVPLSQFAFVGITEQYERSLVLFHKLFASDESLSIKPENVNEARGGARYEVEPQLRERICALNARDLRLYGDAVKKFEHLCSEYSV